MALILVPRFASLLLHLTGMDFPIKYSMPVIPYGCPNLVYLYHTHLDIMSDFVICLKHIPH